MNISDFKLREHPQLLETPLPGDVVHYASGASYRVASDGRWERISAAEREQLVSMSAALDVPMRPLKGDSQ